ncbi:MAG: hypothetical protein KC620_15180 [Myxococcales bacterium]|nr:hypothetical protein [Myxococcales bacterium]
MTANEIAHLLPWVYQRALRDDRLLAGLLDAIEALLDPAEQALVTFPERLDPRQTSDAFVAFLARFVDLDPALCASPDRLRDLVVQAAELHRLRGTRLGLERFLTLATGLTPIDVEADATDETGRSKTFLMRIHCPPGAAGMVPLLTRLIEREKPAHMEYEVVIKPA